MLLRPGIKPAQRWAVPCSYDRQHRNFMQSASWISSPNTTTSWQCSLKQLVPSHKKVRFSSTVSWGLLANSTNISWFFFIPEHDCSVQHPLEPAAANTQTCASGSRTLLRFLGQWSTDCRIKTFKMDIFLGIDSKGYFQKIAYWNHLHIFRFGNQVRSLHIVKYNGCLYQL